ncbi:MAG TPA: dihydroorotate dehydrogenase electron transfer subunit [Bacteroidales bacterium]|nr:dihydroorotate dehydrogenase electron transfer subunit [Bacteroidales bacterium]HNR43206.1 dihydroorotate dehydrogenase electron transfer subunit [Bacteroidales bacterium]HPM18443.1 dihydroorotate dehydrogenase electron transfer subunit [Bacteroidales bacterium]
MPKRIEDFVIRGNKRLNDDFFVLELAAGTPLPDINPGQFAEVKVEGSPETFLRRPFSIHDVDYRENTIKLLIQIAGKGTETLSGLRPGNSLNLVYPLGNSFTIPSAGEKVLLVGGGCGIAPMLYLARKIAQAGIVPGILLGFRNKKRVIEYEDYQEIGDVYLTTEDGSDGVKGLVTGHPVLMNSVFDRMYCCGPEPMMKAVARHCGNAGIACEVSLENLMACGIGTCLCCVVDTVRGNLCTCTDGPVFNTKDLKW